MTKNILAIGAYERDNFGDLLFFIVVKEALKKYDCNLVASSIIFSDMRSLLGTIVYPYNILLENYMWDSVIIVGGEIGNCNIEYALEVSLKKQYLDDYLRFKATMKNNSDGINLAYLPDVKEHQNNQNTLLVINSFGGLREKNGTEKFHNIKKILLSADKISVRSNQSHQFINSIGITNNLAPDVVHVLPIFFPKRIIHKRNYILFQINERLVNKFSVANISRIVSKIIRKYKCNIYLFMAGTATNHDSIETYKELKKTINENLGIERVNIITERDPLKLVDYISNAKAWIGSSLHGRIISSAYSIPRISFVNPKVSEYATIWDSKFPYNVRLNTLLVSCEQAFSISQEEMNVIAKNLTQKANENLDTIVKMVTE